MRELRIVLVDDEPGCLELYRRVIRNRVKRATIVSFSDGNEAWQELIWTPPDLLITDINHPGLSGLEMLKRLANDGADFPVMVISGNAKEQEVKYLAGPNMKVAFLAKPFTPDEFNEALRTCLKRIKSKGTILAKWIIGVTAALSIVAGLFPPWTNTFDLNGDGGGHSRSPAGYHFILTPPPREKDWEEYGIRLDTVRLLIGWTCIAIAGAGAWAIFVPRKLPIHEKRRANRADNALN